MEDGSVRECRWLWCSVQSLLSGQERVNRAISATAERSNGYITQSSRASCSKYMGYIKNCNHIIFIVNCWPYAVESALLNFAKNAFIILPYTRDIHVLAVHVEMSLFTMLTRLNRLSPELPSLTFKIHSQESDLHRAALTSLSSDVSAQNAGVWHIRKPCPSGTGLALRLFPGDSRAVNVYHVCWMLTRTYHNYCLFWGNGRYLFKRISCWTKSIQVQLVLSYSLVNIHCKSLILNQFSFL